MSDLFDIPGTPGSNQIEGRVYPNPFYSYASFFSPRSIESLLLWSEFLWLRNGIFAEIGRRVCRYFLTKLEFSGEKTGADEKFKWETFCERDLKVMVELSSIGEDVLCYGNAFTSLYVPFRRFVWCSGCKVEMPIEKVNCSMEDFVLKFKCPTCQKQNSMEQPIDRPDKNEKRIRLKRWSVKEIKIREHPVSGEKQYLWDIPAYIIQQVKDADPFTIASMPWEIVRAIQSRKLFLFHKDVIHHLRDQSLSGVRTGGWGISRFMTSFNQAFYLEMLKLYNSTIITEYLVPFRLLTPAPGPGAASDPMKTVNMGGWKSNIDAMLRQHRRSPGGYYTAPFPVTYQALGGEGIQLSPFELINQSLDELANSAGFASELYKGTLSIQAAPLALRLFQQTWVHFVHGMNDLLNWLVDSVSRALNWQRPDVKLQPSTLADDMELRGILLQLAAANQVSKTKAFGPLGIDPKEDQKTMFDEQKSFQEAQQRFQDELQHKQTIMQAVQSPVAQAAGAQPAPGGDPSGGGSGGAQGQVTPSDMMGQAQTMATQLLSMNDNQRKQELSKIRKGDQVMHSLVTAQLQQMRSQSRSVGGPQALQAMVGQANQSSQGQVPQG